MPYHARPRPAAPTPRRSTWIGAVWVCLLLLVPWGAAPLGAEEEVGAAARDRIVRWIADLGAEDYATRDAARTALESQAQAAVDLLEAHRDDADPEVRRTVRLLLERLGRPARVEAPPPRDLTGVGVVRLAGRGTLREHFDALAKAHGAEIVLPEDLDAGAVVTLDAARPVPFFQAVRTLGRRAGLVPGDGFDRAGRLAMVRAAGKARPWAAAGPMQVRVAEVTRTRVLPPRGSRRFAVGLDLEWSPAVRLVSWSTPKEIEATDPAGRAYQGGPAMHSRTTHGVSTNATRARVSIHLEPGSDDVEPELGVLAFELPLRIRHGRRELRFAADADLPRTLSVSPSGGAAAGAGRVTLESLEPPEADRGPWMVHLTAHVDGAPASRSLEIRLERADGSLQPAYAGSRFPSADGRLELTARAYGLGDDEPVAVRVSWFEAEAQGVLSFRLTEVPLR